MERNMPAERRGEVSGSQKYCVMCGLPIPDGQNVCSMCYGDIDYGRDGYYREWAERQQADSEPEQEPHP
jgi:hypothetical protein